MGGASGVKDLVFRAYRAGARTVSVHVIATVDRFAIIAISHKVHSGR
jgi:hypothetical protein